VLIPRIVAPLQCWTLGSATVGGGDCPGRTRAEPPFGTPSRSSLAVHASPRIGHSAPGIWDLESLIEDLAHGQEGRVGAHPAGPLASGWRWRWLPRRAPGRSLLCEVPGQRTGAGDHPQRRRRREPPCRACTTRPRRPPIRTLLATPAPRRWSGTDIKTGWTVRSERRWPPGCVGVQPQAFGCGSPEA
jgi:hypothetical protein